jgi:hypothetical protein
MRLFGAFLARFFRYNKRTYLVFLHRVWFAVLDAQVADSVCLFAVDKVDVEVPREAVELVEVVGDLQGIEVARLVPHDVDTIVFFGTAVGVGTARDAAGGAVVCLCDVPCLSVRLARDPRLERLAEAGAGTELADGNGRLGWGQASRN